ncbi:MAG TPA: cytochrome c oxidase assembly factor Coa1 family protein, partial [Acidobacteriaceae bacterium]|nr:cytochrome c oxidase assembly factor Coa1 family protein [Acidobacteriaceae bacterium]
MVSIRKLGRADYLLLPLFLLLAVLGLWLVDSRLRVERQLATLAVERASQSSTITQQLGVPLKTGYLITGNLAMTCCDMGTADLRIPVSGPNGRGTFIEWSQFGYAGW